MTDAFVETVSDWAETATIVFGILVTIAGLFAWWFAKEDASRKEAALEIYKEDSKALIAEANARAGTANQAAGNANERAALLEKEAAVAKLELEKIKERQKFRGISLDQKRAFAQVVRNAAKGKFHMISAIQDAEILHFTAQLKAMFIEAGYESESGESFQMGGFAPEGVILKCKQTASPPAHIIPLQHALRAIGIEAPAAEDTSLDASVVHVLVGRKPD